MIDYDRQVRKHAAEQLYVALLSADPEGPPFDHASLSACIPSSTEMPDSLDLDEAQEILIGAAWEGPLSSVKGVASQLRVSLGFQT